MKKAKKITVIVPIYNALDDVKKLLKSLKKNFNFDLGDCILINDFSNDKTTTYLKNFIKANNAFKLVNNPKNLGFIKTSNYGIKLSESEITVLLNSDTIIPSCFLEKIIKCFKSDKKIGLASPISSNSNAYYIPKRKSYSVQKMNDIINQKHTPLYSKIPEAEGFCFCIRKEVIEKQGFLDEIYNKGYHEEVDYSYKALTKGWKIALIDSLYVYHKAEASFGKNLCNKYKNENDKVFYSRWQGFREKYKKENNLVNPCIAIEKKAFKRKITL